MTRALCVIAVFGALCPAVVLAADYSLLDPQAAAHMAQLEAETAALRAEVARLQQPPTAQPYVGVIPAAYAPAPHAAPDAPAPAAAPAFPAPPSAPAESQYYTLPELQAEMKKLTWKKGDFTITPYGWLWAAMTYETERSFTGDYTFFIFSAEQEGESAFHCDAKSTRLGIDVAGPRIACLNCAPSGGKVEIDFQGQFITENKPGVLLRHAYWEVKDEEFRLLAGQTWDVISPLMPGTIMYSVYWGAGNIGYRRAQFRGERYIAMGDFALLTFQGSLNTNIVSDIAPVGTPAGFAGDHSGWPVVMGRTAITLGDRGKGGHPVTLGLSGHIGEQLFDFTGAPARDDVAIQTWSMCLDLKAPITDRFGFQGEYFIGQNLGSYLGGILQGVDTTLRRGIYSRGGWMEVWYDITPRLHSHVGYTLDDPEDDDLTAGKRRYNSVYWGNLVYDVTKQFNVGFEVGSWRTLYVDRRPGESIRCEFMAKYCF